MKKNLAPLEGRTKKLVSLGGPISYQKFLDKMAEQKGTSRSAELRYCVDRFLEKEEFTDPSGFRIFTCMFDVEVVKYIDSITGENKEYVSRSELVRYAIRDYMHEVRKQEEVAYQEAMNEIKDQMEDLEEAYLKKIMVDAKAKYLANNGGDVK